MKTIHVFDKQSEVWAALLEGKKIKRGSDEHPYFLRDGNIVTVWVYGESELISNNFFFNLFEGWYIADDE